MLPIEPTEGTWWLPGDPAKRISGAISYDDNDGAKLELQGVFVDALIDYPIILGELKNGTPVTIFESITTSLQHGVKETVISNTCVLGAHTGAFEDIVLSDYSVQLLHLDWWLRLSITNGHWGTPDPFANVFYKIDLDDLIIEVVRPFGDHFRKGPNSQQIPPAFLLNFVPSVPLNTEAMSRHIDIIKTFFEIVLGSSTRTSFVGGTLENGTQIDFLFSYGDRHQLDKTNVTPVDWMIEPHRLAPNLELKIKDWMRCYNTFDSSIHLLVASRRPGQYVESNFSQITQALESYHRRTGQGQYMLPALHDAIVGTLVVAIPNSVPTDFRTSLLNRLKFSNERAFRWRIKDMIKKCKPMIGNLFDRLKLDEDIVTTNRNYYTHYEVEPEKSKQVAHGLALNRISESLTALLLCNFLLELSYTENEVQQIINRCNSYKTIMDNN